MKPLLIVNPRSGGGRTGATFDRMRDVIGRALGDFDVHMTERARHATTIAREAALGGRETVVAVGGDGSIHEVVNGLMQARAEGADATRLGVIGQGTGGDFRRTLALEHRLDRYCQAIAEGHTRRVDVGRFRGAGHDESKIEGYFINILSAGMGGLVDQYVAEASGSLGGTAAYFLAAVRALVNGEVGVLGATLTRDGEQQEVELTTRNVAVCNGRYFGSGMQIAPMAELEDGLFEVVALGAGPRVGFVFQNLKVYKGEHLRLPDVRHYRCQEVSFELLNRDAADRFLLDVAGEPLGRLPLTIEVVPRALEVLAP
jgi:YegS/Rv2252/BmrU family lipid kinase